MKFTYRDITISDDDYEFDEGNYLVDSVRYDRYTMVDDGLDITDVWVVRNKYFDAGFDIDEFSDEIIDRYGIEACIKSYEIYCLFQDGSHITSEAEMFENYTQLSQKEVLEMPNLPDPDNGGDQG